MSDYERDVRRINIIFGAITTILVLLCLAGLFYAALLDGRTP